MTKSVTAASRGAGATWPFMQAIQQPHEGGPGSGRVPGTPHSGRLIRLTTVLIAYTSMSNGEVRSIAADLRIRNTAYGRERRSGSVGGPSLRRSPGRSSGLTLAASTASWRPGLHREVSCRCLVARAHLSCRGVCHSNSGHGRRSWDIQHGECVRMKADSYDGYTSV